NWTSVSESFKTRFFNTISCGFMGVLMILTAFLPVENKILCAIFITVTQSLVGFSSAGFYKAATIVTKQYTDFLVALMGVAISTSFIWESFLVWKVAPDSTWDQWFILLVFHGAVQAASNLIYRVLIRPEPEKFTEIKQTEEDNSNQ
ncbi:hypothetical protein PENTCL1PPCAC_29459, partial [Pristionchus entomophagus]